MVRTRKERKAAAEVKLAQPDRSGPSEQTLLDLALERNLFDQADRHPANRRRKNGSHGEGDEGDDGDDGELSPTADRIVDALLWTVSLAMLHFTLDVLVQHQYAMEIVWPDIVTRAFLALIGKMGRRIVPDAAGCILKPSSTRSKQADRSPASLFRLLLRPPSSSLLAGPASWPPPEIPGSPSTSYILRCEYRLRLLPDRDIQQLRIHVHYEALPAPGLSLGLVCYRAQPRPSPGLSSNRVWVLLPGWVFPKAVNPTAVN